MSQRAVTGISDGFFDKRTCLFIILLELIISLECILDYMIKYTKKTKI